MVARTGVWARVAAVRALIAGEPAPATSLTSWWSGCSGLYSAAVRALLPGGVSVVGKDGVGGVAAASDPLSEVIEEIQLTFGEGSCVDAFTLQRRPRGGPAGTAGREGPGHSHMRSKLDMRISNGIIHSVSAQRPALLPLLRSRNQLRLLAALLLAPTRRYTISELAKETGIPQPSVSREVANLLNTSVLTASTERGRKVVQANTDSAIYLELASLLLKTVGPKVVLETALEGAPDVDEAYIYGSWAARYLGEPGSEPKDIDVLVVGTPHVQDIRRRADVASEQLGRDVNVTVLAPAEWTGATSGFISHVRASPLVALNVAASEESQQIPTVAT